MKRIRTRKAFRRLENLVLKIVIIAASVMAAGIAGGFLLYACLMAGLS